MTMENEIRRLGKIEVDPELICQTLFGLPEGHKVVDMRWERRFAAPLSGGSGRGCLEALIEGPAMPLCARDGPVQEVKLTYKGPPFFPRIEEMEIVEKEHSPDGLFFDYANRLKKERDALVKKVRQLEAMLPASRIYLEGESEFAAPRSDPDIRATQKMVDSLLRKYSEQTVRQEIVDFFTSRTAGKTRPIGDNPAQSPPPKPEPSDIQVIKEHKSEPEEPTTEEEDVVFHIDPSEISEDFRRYECQSCGVFFSLPVYTSLVKCPLCAQGMTATVMDLKGQRKEKR